VTPQERLEVVAQAPAAELPALVLAIAARLAQAAGTNGNGNHEAEKWITPLDAATIAGVEQRTIYDWASGKSWASRPSRRCLRIAEDAFRRWLAAR